MSMTMLARLGSLLLLVVGLGSVSDEGFRGGGDADAGAGAGAGDGDLYVSRIFYFYGFVHVGMKRGHISGSKFLHCLRP
jgi:hypothetical protein